MRTLNAFSIFFAVFNIIMADTSGNDVQPVFTPTFEIIKTTSSIILDGDFGDKGWINCNSLSNFVEFQPGENIRPPVETKVMMTYDDKNLYVAFLAYDDPKQIRASYQNRDEAWSDDFVAIIIDTYGDANAGIMMASNPFGIQMDSKNSGNNENPGFDIFYESKGMITAEGYQVEMAIPFSSLSFPDQAEQDWRVTFYRSLPRENRHQIIWGGIDLNNPCWLCQLGHLKGLKGIRQTKSVEF